MKTIAKHKSKTTKLKEQYASNQACIQKAVNLTSLEYYTKVYDTGLEFLNRLYPLHSEFEFYNQFFSKKKSFWVWWKSEWKNTELKMIQHYGQSDLQINSDNWNRRLMILTVDPHVEKSFHENYLRSIKEALNVLNSL